MTGGPSENLDRQCRSTGGGAEHGHLIGDLAQESCFVVHQKTGMLKFVVFAPRDKGVIQKIIDAASKAGAGVVGNYTHCAFITEGFGTWVPQEGARPNSGQIGQFSQEPEVKIEMECSRDKMEAVAAAIKKVHPYDQISIDAVEIVRFEFEEREREQSPGADLGPRVD